MIDETTGVAVPSEVLSPCVNICVVDAAGEYCTGCYRTLDEIAGWATLDNAARSAIIAACDERMAMAFERADS